MAVYFFLVIVGVLLLIDLVTSLQLSRLVSRQGRLTMQMIDNLDERLKGLESGNR